MRHTKKVVLPLALAVLGAEAQAYGDNPIPAYQATNTNGNPSLTDTSYYPACATGSGVTTTIINTNIYTYCPGPSCGNEPTGLTPYSSTATSGTATGGTITATTYTTTIQDVCPTGLADKTITVEEACPCMAEQSRTALPGYTTTEVYCSACATPGTVTVFVENPTATAAIAPGGGDTAVPAAAPTSAPSSGAEGASDTSGSGSSGSNPTSPGSGSGSGSGSNSALPESGSSSESQSNGSESPAGAPGSGSSSAGQPIVPGSGSRVGCTNCTSTTGLPGAGSIPDSGSGSGSSPVSPPISSYTGGASSMHVSLTFLALVCGILAWQL